MMELNEFLFRDDTCAACGRARKDMEKPDYDAGGWVCDKCGLFNPAGSGENAPSVPGNITWPFGWKKRP